MPDCNKILPILNRSIMMHHFLAYAFLDFHLLKEISHWNKAPPCISSSRPYSLALKFVHVFCFSMLSSKRLAHGWPTMVSGHAAQS